MKRSAPLRPHYIHYVYLPISWYACSPREFNAKTSTHFSTHTQYTHTLTPSRTQSISRVTRLFLLIVPRVLCKFILTAQCCSPFSASLARCFYERVFLICQSDIHAAVQKRQTTNGPGSDYQLNANWNNVFSQKFSKRITLDICSVLTFLHCTCYKTFEYMYEYSTKCWAGYCWTC